MMLTAIGLMSGTSLDAVDAVLIRTDGVRVEQVNREKCFVSVEIEQDLRERIKAARAMALRLCSSVSGGECISVDLQRVERDITLLHARAVARLLAENDITAADVDVIGFHGQTIGHRPSDKLTWQIGDASLLAAETGCAVVHDLRRMDIACGGQGAPLVPVFHQCMVSEARTRSRSTALSKELSGPVAVLNIGGVANITWVRAEADLDSPPMIAFDVGPGNALLDDWVSCKTDQYYDRDGALSCSGVPCEEFISRVLGEHAFFEERPPKSLARDEFAGCLEYLEEYCGNANAVADGAATLAALTSAAVARSLEQLPHRPTVILVCGGGRKNLGIVKELSTRCSVQVLNVEDALDMNGDWVEAAAFALLAVRSLRGLPLTLPCTTGVSEQVSGGSLCPGRRSLASLMHKVMMCQ